MSGADLRGAISAANAWVNESGCDCVACIVRAAFQYCAPALRWRREPPAAAGGGGTVSTNAELLGWIVEKCDQYADATNISDAELHAVLGIIRMFANELRRQMKEPEEGTP